MLPKRSIASHLSQTGQYIIPWAWSCNREASVANNGTRPWNSQCPVGRTDDDEMLKCMSI